MRFKDLDKEYVAANYRCDMANKHRRKVLDLMVDADKAKVIEDGDYEFYIVAAPGLLKSIQSMEMDGEDVRYFGIDEAGYAEAKDQCCDPSEFWDEIVLAPGEKVDWYIREYA
jgi:hypothetical protein